MKFTALAFLLIFGVTATSPAFQVGEAAPDFTLNNLNGKPVSLSDFKGRPVVLEISTTWCPGCRFQFQEVAKIAERYAPDEVGIVKVFVQELDSSVRSFVEDNHGHPEQVLLDDDSVLQSYSVYLIPRLIIIDGQGLIRHDGSMMKADDIAKKLKPLLEQPKGDTPDS
ncbi:MAG: TlpA family protein disulfide reductase [Deltaproteobacteria bacterium]|jgi:peroxiredoxin|nr:TlpA family protein disulfide reductase [Deltaproteobacteria bacterium]